jgi:hypothetical protein
LINSNHLNKLCKHQDGSSIVSAPHNRSHEEVVSISNLLVQIAEHEERNELSEADNKRLTAEVNRLEAAVEEAQELFNEQCALCEAATADATRAQHAESEVFSYQNNLLFFSYNCISKTTFTFITQARDSLALERDRANELESDKKLIAERLASLEMRAAQYVSEAESRYDSNPTNSQFEPNFGYVLLVAVDERLYALSARPWQRSRQPSAPPPRLSSTRLRWHHRRRKRPSCFASWPNSDR